MPNSSALFVQSIVGAGVQLLGPWQELLSVGSVDTELQKQGCGDSPNSPAMGACTILSDFWLMKAG